ncbi:putative FmdB family regulatory protein [Pseudonocardia hierapolitana]|uniref:Putative FmdB family regulatory protein n=1 Tax=Pseudonocardia hierapolitana TaxID=1128676 RepID=A0A561SP42_9PSEU|nr:FmdB family zinc ribbon protein [Pseudonocardia hierapolitana]TWF76631.1 putative FmdB family regulatory protein [Pseudonocardia hierapolitana]
MPTYQYACTACDHRFEAVQSFTDASLTECPACSGNLRKVFSSVGIVFKGSGFYRTDSRSGGGGVAANSDSAKSDSGKSDSGKSDSGSSSGGSSSGGSKESSSSSSSSATPAAAAS